MSDSRVNKSQPETIVLGEAAFLSCECRHGTHSVAACHYCSGTGKRTHPSDSGGFGGELCSRCEGSGSIEQGRCPKEGVTYSIATGKLLWVCGDCMENHPKKAATEKKFVSVRTAVMQGSRCVGRMVSKTMAKRTANALNRHKPNREGV